MGIREQIIYYTSKGNLKPYLTISFFAKQSVSRFQAGKYMGKLGKKEAQISPGRWAAGGKHDSSSFFISSCKEVSL